MLIHLINLCFVRFFNQLNTLNGSVGKYHHLDLYFVFPSDNILEMIKINGESAWKDARINFSSHGLNN